MKRKFEMDELVRYCNQYGFIFQGSELYGGLANTWDYGPLGTRLKNNIKDAWRYYFIQLRENSYELDSDILMNPTVWEASGHLAGFTDPLLDCKGCNMRHRADNLINEYDSTINADSMSQESGVENSIVHTSTDALTGAAKLGEMNVIIGGGLVGCETALSVIMDHGKKAIIIEALDGLLVTADHCTNNDQKLRAIIDEQKLESICSAKVTEIGNGYVLYERNGTTERLDCDSVILACGYISNNQFAEDLKDISDIVKIIGDSKAPRKIYDAVHVGFHTARLLFCD